MFITVLKFTFGISHIKIVLETGEMVQPVERALAMLCV